MMQLKEHIMKKKDHPTNAPPNYSASSNHSNSSNHHHSPPHPSPSPSPSPNPNPNPNPILNLNLSMDLSLSPPPHPNPRFGATHTYPTQSDLQLPLIHPHDDTPHVDPSKLTTNIIAMIHPNPVRPCSNHKNQLNTNNSYQNQYSPPQQQQQQHHHSHTSYTLLNHNRSNVLDIDVNQIPADSSPSHGGDSMLATSSGDELEEEEQDGGGGGGRSDQNNVGYADDVDNMVNGDESLIRVTYGNGYTTATTTFDGYNSKNQNNSNNKEDDDGRSRNRSILLMNLMVPASDSSHATMVGMDNNSKNSDKIRIRENDEIVDDGDGDGDDDLEGKAFSDKKKSRNNSSRKKLRLSKKQSALLEESFKQHSTLNPKQKNALSKQLNLRPRQVEVWFQNRRARTKLKQTEVDCELLKRCCESLTEENRRLQQELHELRRGTTTFRHAAQLPTSSSPSPNYHYPSFKNNAILPQLIHHISHDHNNNNIYSSHGTLTTCHSCEHIGATPSTKSIPIQSPTPIQIPHRLGMKPLLVPGAQKVAQQLALANY